MHRFDSTGLDRYFSRSLQQGCCSEALQGCIHGRPAEITIQTWANAPRLDKAQSQAYKAIDSAVSDVT